MWTNWPFVLLIQYMWIYGKSYEPQLVLYACIKYTYMYYICIFLLDCCQITSFECSSLCVREYIAINVLQLLCIFSILKWQKNRFLTYLWKPCQRHERLSERFLWQRLTDNKSAVAKKRIANFCGALLIGEHQTVWTFVFLTLFQQEHIALLWCVNDLICLIS